MGKALKLAVYVKTDVGMVRDHNEDAAYADPQGMFFVVADGMGGHAAGEVASAMAVEQIQSSLSLMRPTIKSFVLTPTEEGQKKIVDLLEKAVKKAHMEVFERGGREPDKRGMGTTLDVVLLANTDAFIAHVGDSRTYLVRDDAAVPITTDHTVAEVLVNEGKLSVDEARNSPLRTILVNALGVTADVGVELAHVDVMPRDKILLCSDGLHDYFPIHDEVADILATHPGERGLTHLIELAKERGGHDNITGILIEVLPQDGVGTQLDSELSKSRKKKKKE